jgi:hypothetical protein
MEQIISRSIKYSRMCVHNTSTTDQIFCIRQILERKWEYNKTVYELFVDFEKACDSFRREVLYNILTGFVVPIKLVSRSQRSQDLRHELSSLPRTLGSWDRIGVEENIWTKRDKVTGGWRNLHDMELYNLFIIRMVLSRRMRWAEHAARMGEEECI